MSEGLYDLEERTFVFAKEVAFLCKKLPRSVENIEYMKQVIRSSGSSGANYIEANERLGEKDFSMHIRISRREAKESAYWLRLIKEVNDGMCCEECEKLIGEANELRKIFSSILIKVQKP